MNASEKQQSRVITERLHELEEIIEGDRDCLSSVFCGLCSCDGIVCPDFRTQPCECPLSFCDTQAAAERRLALQHPLGLRKYEVKALARRHHAFLIKLLEKNGWEYC